MKWRLDLLLRVIFWFRLSIDALESPFGPPGRKHGKQEHEEEYPH
jgi:hypothetical protein